MDQTRPMTWSEKTVANIEKEGGSELSERTGDMPCITLILYPK